VPKSATVAEYHDSTALEALVGYLVLSGQQKRLDDIMLQIYAYTKEYCRIVHGIKE
jgi:ribonuclease-3 family protein